MLPLPLILACAGCLGFPPDCRDAKVRDTIAEMFRHQLKLTPYLAYIDMDKAQLNVEAIFTIGSSGASSTCVAFARYDVTLNERGQQVKGHNDLLYNLVSELRNEKQIYYSVTETNGRVDVHVNRVSG